MPRQYPALDKMLRIFKTLSDQSRLAIFIHIINSPQGMSLTNVKFETGICMATGFYHLKELFDCGLIEIKGSQGRRIIYQASSDARLEEGELIFSGCGTELRFNLKECLKCLI